MRLSYIHDGDGVAMLDPMCKLLRRKALHRYFIFIFLQTAELLIIEILRCGNGRVITTERAAAVMLYRQQMRPESQCIHRQQFPRKMLADADDQLQRFICLDAPDDAGQGTDGSAFRTGGNQPGRRRFRINAPKTGAVPVTQDAHLAFKLIDGAENERNAGQHAGIIDKISGFIVIRAVDHKIIAFDQLQGIFRGELCILGDHFNISIHISHGIPGRCNLRALHIPGAVDHLALKISERHRIEIDDLQCSHPCGREILDHRGTEGTGTHNHNPCRLDPLLSFHADLPKEKMLVEPLDVLIIQRYRLPPFIGNDPPILPVCRCAPRHKGEEVYLTDRIQRPAVIFRVGVILLICKDPDEASELAVFTV